MRVDLLCIILSGALLIVATTRAAEPTVNATDLPRVLPVEPAKAIDTFELKKGLKLELAACEPQVTSPVAMCFDERGRLFVVEMRDYPDRRDEKLGRIRLLEDNKGNGVYDKATIYAEGLPWPTGIICYDGGVFVVASPDIIYLKDTHGDGVADQRQVVCTGFGAGVARLNVQGLPNSLTWGLDNRIHGATSSNGGKITRLGQPSMPPLELRGQDFSFDPRTLEIRAESGGGQHGMSFNTTGRKFVCSNSHHLQAIMYDARYAGRNPLYAMPSPLVDIAVDGPAAEIFRISPDEAWRVIRTKWRVSGLVSGPIEGGGRPSGYFSGATGLVIYTGNALPPEFVDNAFVADCGGNLVHRKIIKPDGAGFIAQRPADEQKREFLASRDIWFRPVSLTNGPDGALYVIDMYREVIEHPWSLPDSIKEHLDLHSGTDRGRIWRIVPENFKRPALPRLDRATTAELVATLEHPNGWHRETAARLLYQRQDKPAAPLLVKMLESSKSAIARMHAMYALEGLGALDEAHIVDAMLDVDEVVRMYAVRLSERLLHRDAASQELWDRLLHLAVRAGPRMSYQMALSLAQSDDRRKVPLLSAIGRRHPSDARVRNSVLNAAAGHESDLVHETFGEIFESFQRPLITPTLSRDEVDLLKELVTLIGATNNDTEVVYVSRVINALRDDPEVCLPLANGLAAGLKRSRGTPTTRDVPAVLMDMARGAVVDQKAPLLNRVEAIALVGAAHQPDSIPLLLSLLRATEPQPIQSAAITALDGLEDKTIADELVKRLAELSPRLRSEAIAMLLKRPERATVLLHAIEAGTVRADVLSTTQALTLKTHHDPQLKALARKVLAQNSAKRDDVIKEFQPALELNGRADRGKAIYRQRCVSCHRSGGEGFAVGPDFVTIKTAGKEKNLVNILDPNREVAPQYVSYVVETKGGETLTGIIVGETAGSLTVRQPYGNETTVLRSEVKNVASQNISLMPEGLETGLSKQDVADLLEYIEKSEK